MAFIDLGKVYDRVNRMKLLEALSEMGTVGRGACEGVHSQYDAWVRGKARVKVGESIWSGEGVHEAGVYSYGAYYSASCILFNQMQGMLYAPITVKWVFT